MNNKQSKKTNNFNKKDLFLVTRKIVNNTLIKVLEAKNLVENFNYTVLNATKEVKISRTTYYKYFNDIFYYDNKDLNRNFELELITIDKIGMLSNITNIISKNMFNIVTINQNKPVKNYSKITILISTNDNTSNITKLAIELKKTENIKEVNIIKL